MSDGRYAYSTEVRATEVPKPPVVSERLLNAFYSGYISCDYSGNIVVVKTIVGMAPPCALAVDSMLWPEVVGTIAGDDTIMVVTRSLDASKNIVLRFNTLKEKVAEV